MTPGVGQHLAEDTLSDLGLHQPGDLLEVLGHVVGIARAPVELEGVPADDFAPADVGAGESAGDHAADVLPRFQEDGLQPHAGTADGGDGAPGGAAVDGKVVSLCAGRGRACQEKQKALHPV